MAEPQEKVVLVETPRDAFQGLPRFVPTEEKIRYAKAVLAAGFTHLDVGSFVSPKAVPQMADSEQVVRALPHDDALTLIALVANERGVDRAVNLGGLDMLGFPFSVSNEFQKRNTNRSISDTWSVVEGMITRTEQHDMSFLVYLSMAFGNPYGETWDLNLLLGHLYSLARIGVRHIALSDTTGEATPAQVVEVFARAKAELPAVHFSAHFHGRPGAWQDNVHAALEAGCRSFDGALGGTGGCPFAKDELVSNLPTEGLVELLHGAGFQTGVRTEGLREAVAVATELREKYG